MDEYQKAGVDIEAAAEVVENIKIRAAQTPRQNQFGGLGGFAALFRPNLEDTLGSPVLVTSTDGVGTKLLLAQELERHYEIGIDLVAMSANDVVCGGGDPTLFLDYMAMGSIDKPVVDQVMEGIVEGCKHAGCALVGGELAEMPGMYEKGVYDLAGFCLGIAYGGKDLFIPERIQQGDVLIGLGSSGLHSNGFSLVRQILAETDTDVHGFMGDQELGSILLEPTRIYAKAIKELKLRTTVLGLAHITGGGIIGNVPRMLNSHVQAEINLDSWEIPEVFHWVKSKGRISDATMAKTFNMGIGMVTCVPGRFADTAIRILKAQDVHAWKLGRINRREHEPALKFVRRPYDGP